MISSRVAIAFIAAASVAAVAAIARSVEPSVLLTPSLKPAPAQDFARALLHHAIERRQNQR